MTRDHYRTIGAVTGLVMGLGLMTIAGLGGLVFAAIFGAGGCVLGGITGERLFDKGGIRKQ